MGYDLARAIVVARGSVFLTRLCNAFSCIIVASMNIYHLRKNVRGRCALGDLILAFLHNRSPFFYNLLIDRKYQKSTELLIRNCHSNAWSEKSLKTSRRTCDSNHAVLALQASSVLDWLV